MSLQDALREISEKVSYMTAVGAGTFAGWLANNWLGFAGVLIAALGLVVNWYYNHKRLKLQERQRDKY